MHIGEVTFSSNFCFVETVSRFKQRFEIQELSLDIETGTETFDSWVLISRLAWRLLKFESWYQDWNWDYQILSLDIETGIETFEITVLISRLVLRLKKTRGDPCDRDSCESHCSSLVLTIWIVSKYQAS